ncbi:Aminopeptidase M1 [Linum perenne]
MDEFKGQPRLPKFAIPKHYHIHLKPNLNTFKFAGSLAVDLDIVSATKFIVLNAADLSITPASVSFTATSQAAKPVKSEAVEADEILIFEFPEAISVGLGVLKLEYEGVLNDKLKGFYRSAYTINGEKKHMAVTQFEPVDARRCFPCWDEPALKATFKITLDAPSELVALSNMPVMEEKVDGSIKTLIYQDTPLMSTYLVAVVIGLLDYVEDHTADGVKVRVYCQVGKANQGKFALDVAVKTLDLYKEYFATPYPLPKLDMIAIPDFAAGAMENYGLVTYRETALLYDDKNSAAANKQRVATVVAHELAHQWFGNLVTMEWWTHLWLNEGFATWVEINHASEIDEIFDAISYRKGASVIRMLQSFLGAEPFQRSLAAYIKRHAYSNAKTEDLWAALEEGSGEPVTKLMNSWTSQKGYPVIAVKVKEQKLEFEQTQFLSSGAHGDGQWIVPITLCCGSYDERKNFLLDGKSETVDVKEFLGSSTLDQGSIWLKINVDQTGFYRVKYDDDLAARLRRAIGKKCLNETDRFGILDDAFALCMARHQPLTSLLTLMGAYWEELEYTVLSNLITVILTYYSVLIPVSWFIYFEILIWVLSLCR